MVDPNMFDPKLLLLNIQGLNFSKIDELFMCTSIFKNLNILCLTETHAKNNTISNLIIDDFELASLYCRTRHECGGVGIWLKSHMSFKKIDLFRFCQEKHIEICGVLVKNENNMDTIIIACYRSPSGELSIFFDTLYEILNYVYKPYIHIILCGDFNLDSYNQIDDYKDFIYLCNMLGEFNLTPKIKWPTRVSHKKVKTIDHVFMNFEGCGVDCVLDNITSDHRTVLLEFKTKSTFTNEYFVHKKRRFNDDSIRNFETGLVNENWSNLYCIQDINTAFSYFTGIFYYYFNVNFPLKKRYDKINRKKWITEEIQLSSQNVKNLFYMMKISPKIKITYLEAKRQHKKLIERTKKQYFQNKIFNSDNTNKATWRVVSEITKREKHHKNITIESNEGLLTNPYDIANGFNSFFKSAPIQTLNEISRNSPAREKNTPVTDTENRMILYPFTDEEFYNLVYSKLKSKNSGGPDDVPSFLIKRILFLIVKPLVYLINLSFCTGEFPSILKTGKVIPLFKKNSPLEMKNYRPVTVPYCFSKIFEYCFLDRFLFYLNTNNIITPNQHGFSRGKSTLTAFHCFYERLIYYIEAGECPVGIFCDLSRAFDCVNHDLLLEKLSHYGINGIPHNWLCSFLRNRTQYVSIMHYSNNSVSQVQSNSVNIDTGVPQGSVLGPVLFICYINELDKIYNGTLFTMYADDTSIIISDKNDDRLNHNSVTLLTKISEWFATNHLYLNIEKTNWIRFHNRQKTVFPLNLKINTNILPIANEVKFLGIYLDEGLNFKSHCEHLISSINIETYKFRNLRTVLTERQMVCLYYALIESRLRYGLYFWGWSALAQNVFVSQKRIIRCIAGVSNLSSCKNLFRNYEILTLPSLFIYEMCIYVFVNKDNFKSNSNYHNFNTRHSNDIFIPFAKYNVGVKSPNILGPKMFNDLPVDIKLCETLKSFKRKLKMFLIDKCFYAVSEYF